MRGERRFGWRVIFHIEILSREEDRESKVNLFGGYGVEAGGRDKPARREE